MKKLLLILAVLTITISGFAQDRQSTYHVPDSTTNFNASLAIGSIVFDEGADKFWKLTARAYGTDNLSTIAKTLVAGDGAGGGEDLSTTLSLGNITGANDISIDSNQVLKSTNGSSILDLRNASTNGNILIDNSIGGIPGASINLVSDTNKAINIQSGGFGVNTNYSYINTSVMGISNWVVKNDFTKFGLFQMYANDTNDVVGFPFNSYPFMVASNGGVIKQGVVNSVIIGGVAPIAKTNATAYSNQFGFNAGESFETILDYTTATHDNTQTLQDTSGTIALLSNISNIYSNDGTLTGARTLTQGSNDLVFGVGASSGEVRFSHSLNHPLVQISDNSGIPVIGLDAGGTQNSYFSMPLAVGGTSTVGGGFLDVQIPNGSLVPFAIYENRVGGANVGDKFDISFDYNESGGSRIAGTNNIISRVESVGVGVVNTSLQLGNFLKVQSNGRVIIGNSVLTDAALAQFEVRGEDAVPTAAITMLVSGRGTGTRTVLALDNEIGDNLHTVQSNGKSKYNGDQIGTADFQILGQTDVNLFYTDVSANSIGIGTNTPHASTIMDLNSTTKGFSLPDQTTAQMNAITSPKEGLLIYNTTESQMYFYNSTAWEAVHHAHVYGAMGFADSLITIAMTQNNWFQITNPSDSLYNTGVTNGAIIFAGDSIQINKSGDYDVNWDLSFKGANNDEYHVAIFINGVQQVMGEGIRDMSSANIGNMTSHTILSITTGDWICIRIKNVNNDNDATVVAGNLTVKKI